MLRLAPRPPGRSRRPRSPRRWPRRWRTCRRRCCSGCRSPRWSWRRRRGEGGHADHRADRRVLVDRVGGGVAVGRGRDRELVDVVDRDRERLPRCEPSALGRPHRRCCGWRRRPRGRSRRPPSPRRWPRRWRTGRRRCRSGCSSRCWWWRRRRGEARDPTNVPIAAFSSTALAAALLSAGVVTANSLTSLIAIVKACVRGRAVGARSPAPDVRGWRRRLPVDRAGHRHHAAVARRWRTGRRRCWSAIAHGVGRGVGVAGEGGDPDHRADGRRSRRPRWRSRRCRPGSRPRTR